jgi:hypothetical protein
MHSTSVTGVERAGFILGLLQLRVLRLHEKKMLQIPVIEFG